jgi:hypothetical protein
MSVVRGRNMRHRKLVTALVTMTLAGGLTALWPIALAHAEPQNDNDTAFAHGGNGGFGGAGLNNEDGAASVDTGTDTSDPVGLLDFLF